MNEEQHHERYAADSALECLKKVLPKLFKRVAASTYLEDEIEQELKLRAKNEARDFVDIPTRSLRELLRKLRA